MKKLLIAILAVAALANAEGIEQVNGSNFNLDNVTCKAEFRTYEEPATNKFIVIECNDHSEFSASVYYLASHNSCNVRKIVDSDTVSYGLYYVKDASIYESIKDEYGIDVSVKKVNIDCVDIYETFKSKVKGRVRTGKYKCNNGHCYWYYDDGTKVKDK